MSGSDEHKILLHSVRYICSQKSQLKQNVATVHGEKNSFKCEVCDYRSAQKSNLKAHISSVHDGNKCI